MIGPSASPAASAPPAMMRYSTVGMRAHPVRFQTDTGTERDVARGTGIRQPAELCGQAFVLCRGIVGLIYSPVPAPSGKTRRLLLEQLLATLVTRGELRFGPGSRGAGRRRRAARR